MLRGKGNTFYSDIFSFAIALFWNLTGQHPFVGPQLEEKLDEEEFLSETEETFACGCDVEWIRDEENDENYSDTPVPYELLVGEKLHNCFKKTFSRTGRHKRLTRPTMMEWGEALAYEMDHSIKCKKCEMEYDSMVNKSCPWCDEKNKYVSFSCYTNNDDRTEQSYVHEVSNGIKVPIRLVKGFSVSEINEIIFEIAVVKGEIIIENFNSRFDFERKQDGVYQKIFGKYVLDEDAQIRVTDRTTAEEYLVDYALKG